MNSFQEEVFQRIDAQQSNLPLVDSARAFLEASIPAKYSYNFSWLGRPIIQYPQDIVAMQELIWRVKPDLIIETGIAHGGSAVFSASTLALLDLCEAIETRQYFDPAQSRRKVLAVDIDIRAHNRAAVEAHPMASRIQMIQGSSTAADVVAQVKAVAAEYSRILVCLDSNHTHEHVLGELKAYAPLVSKGSYCVVFDTIVENLPAEMFSDRPWSPGDNPRTAVEAFLESIRNETTLAMDGVPLGFEVDHAMDAKLLISVAPHGFLRRVQ